MRQIVSALFLMLPLLGHADWVLDKDRSQLNFVSIKNGSVAEVHHFTDFAVELDNRGKLQVLVDLGSVDTGIAVRDERLKRLLFNVDIFPQAMVTASIPRTVSANLREGTQRMTIPAVLSLNGVEKPLKLPVSIVSFEGRMLVTTNTPIFLQPSWFGLGAGVEVLKEVAGLSSITPVIPVTFTVELIRR